MMVELFSILLAPCMFTATHSLGQQVETTGLAYIESIINAYSQ